MKNKLTRSVYFSTALLTAFAMWTVLVCTVDKKAIGPQGSVVGFASLNSLVRNAIGVNFGLYTVTDWLGLVPIGFMFAFAILGLVQWIKRKKLLTVDADILLLGGFYLLLATVYLLFEIFTVNYRPTLINGILEASYPSSTTLLTACVMPTTAMILNKRTKRRPVRQFTAAACTLFTAFMVIGRLFSGVHWFSDIVGGLLFSVGFVLLFKNMSSIVSKQ